MAKRFDQQLAALQRAVNDPSDRKGRALIVKALEGKSGLLIATATGAVVGGDEDDPVVDRGLLELLPPAFFRLMEDPVQRDPQCRGKAAIAKALRRAEAHGDEVFVAGVRHVQREPVWGGSVDTAAELRGVCLMALVEEHHPRAMVEAARLLADPLAAARTAAARALGASGRTEVAEPLLRLRVEAGESDAEVLGECLRALLQVAPRENLEVVARLLDADDEPAAEAAALVLGESRLPGAFEALHRRAERSVGRRRRVLLLALALLRSEEAWDYLLQLVEQGSRGVAVEAIEALAAFAHDERLAERVRVIVERRAEPALTQAMVDGFEVRGR
ncbi:hypothetical protein [Paraliomyxa miuraensis]|uniref:hypothetical protein n=1 Tax=Paraliomyxa miuraensis TaxID=376150 RepID=UPI0022559CB0|nr:hypothetical protein [Paraliomyxa miuraensis]MCX4241775.1 hypothetical protein [Paraliomyxa miuraensis]